MNRLSPSILSADFSKLLENVLEVERGGSDLIHIDVMDGHFVPNISFGATVMKSLLGKTKAKFDVHLMIEDPDKYLEGFVTENTEYITIHAEACNNLHRTITHIKSLGIKAGVSINPATSLTALDYILPEVDMVLIMSVNPGFGGQKFIDFSLEKAKVLSEIRRECELDFQIEMDGGITLDNVKSVVDSGVDIIVAGSAIFNKDGIYKNTKEFLSNI